MIIKPLRVLFVLIALTVLTHGLKQQILGQVQPVMINKAALPEIENASRIGGENMSQDQPTVNPGADLVIKDMCFNQRSGKGFNSVSLLLANIGTIDAGTFHLGFDYITSEGTSRFALDKINGLKAGEERWIEQQHICCGLVPTMFLVDLASRYHAIADPKYFKRGALPTQGTWIAPVIPETNESNNKMLVNKSDLRSCTQLRSVEIPKPARIEPIRPPQPRKPN